MNDFPVVSKHDVAQSVLEHTAKFSREMQDSVDIMVRKLGGYWRPLSGLARLLEELAELSEELGRPQPTADAIGAELADVIIIATCIANQYCADLYSGILKCQAGDDDALPDAALELFRVSGKIARTLNHYEGDKRPKLGETLPTVASSVARLYFAAGRLGAHYGLDVPQYCQEKISVTLKRDAGRFVQVQDPSTSSALKRFAIVQGSTTCPFAGTARIWGAPEWQHGLTLEDNVAIALPWLHRFARTASHEGLDGFVFEIPESSYGPDILTLATTVKRVLTHIAAHDPSGENCLTQSVTDPNWRFTFANESLFVASFAPFYGTEHPRSTQGINSIMIFLQSESSFDRRLGMDPGAKERIHDTIRDLFAQRGQGYNFKDAEKYSDAYKFIKPLAISHPLIAWWEND